MDQRRNRRLQRAGRVAFPGGRGCSIVASCATRRSVGLERVRDTRETWWSCCFGLGKEASSNARRARRVGVACAALPPSTLARGGGKLCGSNAAGSVVVGAAARDGRLASFFAKDAEATGVALDRHDRRSATVTGSSCVVERVRACACEHGAGQDRIGLVRRIGQVVGRLVARLAGRFGSVGFGVPLRGPIENGVHKAVFGHGE